MMWLRILLLRLEFTLARARIRRRERRSSSPDHHWSGVPGDGELRFREL